MSKILLKILPKPGDLLKLNSFFESRSTQV